MQRLKIFILIAGFSLVVYANSLSNSFHFDDQHYIVTNPYITDLSNIPSFFKSTRYSSFEMVFTAHYRPLLMTSYALNYAMGGLNPAGYHAVNLLFHAGSAFLVFLILEAMLERSGDTLLNSKELSRVSLERLSQELKQSRRDKNVPPIDRRGFLTPSVVVAVAAALIFAVHPFNSEVVNYITARSSVMCAFFYLLAFYCWVKYRQVGGSGKLVAGSSEQAAGSGLKGFSATRYPLPAAYFYVASLLAFALAMLTKEIAITLPVVLFLYDLYFQKIARVKTVINLIAYLPYILLVIIPYLLYRVYSFGRVMGGEPRVFFTNLLTQPRVLLRYLQLLFLPAGLTIEHTIALASEIYDVFVILPILALIFLTVAAYLLFKKA